MFHKTTQERRLIAVDVENVAGGAITAGAAAIWVKNALIDAVGLRSTDHIVVGTSHIGLISVGRAWPSARYVMQSGVDGADLALLEVLDENVADRFAEVVLASGDHIFANSLAALACQGVTTTLVGRRGRTSFRSILAAQKVLYIDGSYYGDATRALQREVAA